MSIGKISEFKVQTDNWKLYVERLEQYFLVNKIPSDLHVPTLITVMGAECYELLVNLCTPVKPTSKSFSELTNILEKHLQPKPSILAERFRFRHRQQKEGEGLAEYVAVLKKMSKTCEFGSWLEESLRDQFVCGIISETIRQRLFAEDNLDFAKAYRLAVSLEAAEKNAAIVEGPSGLPGGKETVECQAIAGTSQRKAGFEFDAASRGGRRSRYVGRGQGARGSSQAGRGSGSEQCRVCGRLHSTASCRFRSYTCRVCNRPGHLRRVCPNLAEQHCVEVPNSTSIATDSSEDSDEVTITNLNKLTIQQCKPIVIKLNVNGINISMECDTGSAVSCISYEVYDRLFHDLELQSSQLRLRYYTGECVSPVGVLRPLVKYKQVEKHLDLYVIRDGKTNLIGRQWLMELNIKLPDFECSVNSIKDDFSIKEFSSRYCNVFADGLGRFTGGAVSIHLRPGAAPVFMRARPLAYALRQPVERALEQLTRDGILTPVERSDWATPIVPVVKKDGNIRICADYKLTLNKVIEVDRYPLPRVEDLLTRLHGGERFSKIDLSQAYAQFELDERSRQCTVINTHKGLFKYNRLVFGLSSSPGIFQKKLESLLADLPHVGVFLDDIIITGSNNSEHIRNLHKVFERLQSNGLRVKKEKCSFFAESINYLGHVISKAGVHTCPDKVKAIVKTPAPTNVSELRAFIGMVMYYAKFIKNVSTILAPLYNLLRVGVAFNWNKECQDAFAVIKNKLMSSEVLVHYSVELPLVLTTDASSVGVGAVISQVTAQGERPVAYASRSLTTAERAYSQIDREALAIVFGIRKFHQYLYGRKFTLRTDHKPLTYIFGNKVGIPVMAASRLQRWAVLLSGYNYEIEYIASGKNCADALSRLPSKSSDKSVKEVTYVNFVEKFLPITHGDVRKYTAKDRVLSRVMSYVQSGWPASCSDEEVKPYYLRRNELYCERGCIMWGYRLVVPQQLQEGILKQLHVGHMGIVKTKAMARSYVWWPNVDAQVEATCKQCETCAMEAAAPPRAPPQPWPYHVQPWSRLHIDFLGPISGKTFLILVDSTSKWLEIFEMPRTNASSVIKVLRQTFARFGLPLEVVSDQGPPYSSVEFKEFLASNGIRQSFSPVYHPASNGAAENAVKLCKHAIKKANRDNVDLDAALQAFLLAYRNSVHCTTGESPAYVLQRRALRSRLDLLRGDRAREEQVRDAQTRQTALAGGTSRVLSPGELVWAREYGAREKWSKGTVTTNEGSRRFLVDTGNDRILRRHIDQIRRRSRMSDVPCPEIPSDKPGEARNEDVDAQGKASVEDASENASPNIRAGPEIETEEDGKAGQNVGEAIASSPEVFTTPPSVNPPKRVRKPVVRFQPYS